MNNLVEKHVCKMRMEAVAKFKLDKEVQHACFWQFMVTTVELPDAK
jgi:hypothetical protein